MRAALTALVLSLAGCAVAVEPPLDPPEVENPDVDLTMTQSGAPARDLLERVAAECWLNDVVGGASMVVDRSTGRVVITSDTEDLLVAEPFAEAAGTRVRLTGPAAVEPGTAQRLSETMEAAVTTGRTTCPAATG